MTGTTRARIASATWSSAGTARTLTQRSSRMGSTCPAAGSISIRSASTASSPRRSTARGGKSPSSFSSRSGSSTSARARQALGRVRRRREGVPRRELRQGRRGVSRVRGLEAPDGHSVVRGPLRRAAGVARGSARSARTELDLLRSRRGRADLALFHEFAPSPSGGGHQFLRALVRELERRGLEVEAGRSPAVRPCASSTRSTSTSGGCGASLAAGRGWCTASTGRSARTEGSTTARTRGSPRSTPSSPPRRSSSREFSLEKHRELGFELREPVVIPNAVDPAIFHPPTGREPLEGRRVRVVATSWSDNPRKGAEALAWLDRNLDPTASSSRSPGGRRRRSSGSASSARSTRARSPSCSATQDVYVAPSRDDPCSNALLEALACGLPAAYRDSGGHPELVGEGGLPFREDEELGDVARAPRRRARRAAGGDLDPSLAWVADRYLEVLGLRRRHLESRDRGELPATRYTRRPLPGRQAPRPRGGLARARRPLPVGRVDRGDLARRSGAQEPARPLGLPGDHGRDAARAHRRDRDVPRGERVLPRLDLRPARRGRGRLDRHRGRARRLPDPPADHIPRRAVVDRSGCRRRGPRRGRRGSGRS